MDTLKSILLNTLIIIIFIFIFAPSNVSPFLFKSKVTPKSYKNIKNIITTSQQLKHAYKSEYVGFIDAFVYTYITHPLHLANNQEIIFNKLHNKLFKEYAIFKGYGPLITEQDIKDLHYPPDKITGDNLYIQAVKFMLQTEIIPYIKNYINIHGCKEETTYTLVYNTIDKKIQLTKDELIQAIKDGKIKNIPKKTLVELNLYPLKESIREYKECLKYKKLLKSINEE